MFFKSDFKINEINDRDLNGSAIKREHWAKVISRMEQTGILLL